MNAAESKRSDEAASSPAIAGLVPGEQVLWAGGPRPFVYARRRLMPSLLVAVGLLLLTGLWELDTISHHHAAVLTAAGWLFLPAGLYGALVRPWLLMRFARRQAYVVTDRRVLRARHTKDGPLEIIEESDWRPPVLVAGGRGNDPARGRAGDVILSGPPDSVPRWGWWGLDDDGGRFVCLADPQAALDALEELRAGSAAPAGAWTQRSTTP